MRVAAKRVLSILLLTVFALSSLEATVYAHTCNLFRETEVSLHPGKECCELKGSSMTAEASIEASCCTDSHVTFDLAERTSASPLSVPMPPAVLPTDWEFLRVAALTAPVALASAEVPAPPPLAGPSDGRAYLLQTALLRI